jgi:hypothetical protein
VEGAFLMTKFMPYTGDLMGLPTNNKHINFLWCEPGCKVLFSVTRQGAAASCHFASDKAGMKKIKRGIKEFCKFVFYLFEWCEAVIAKTDIKKVKSIIKKCGFVEVLKSNTNLSVYALRRGIL